MEAIGKMEGWDFLGAIEKRGGNDERVSYSESAAGQAAAATAGALLTAFLDSMLLQHNLHNLLCSRQVFCSI